MLKKQKVTSPARRRRSGRGAGPGDVSFGVMRFRRQPRIERRQQKSNCVLVLKTIWNQEDSRFRRAHVVIMSRAAISTSPPTRGRRAVMKDRAVTLGTLRVVYFLLTSNILVGLFFPVTSCAP